MDMYRVLTTGEYYKSLFIAIDVINKSIMGNKVVVNLLLIYTIYQRLIHLYTVD